MQTIKDLPELEDLKTSGALMILFGGANCGVCQTIKPQLEKLFNENFPLIHQVYIDCNQSAEICAQHQVFTLPVLQVYIEGQCFIEKARVFSLSSVMEQLNRPYELWSDAN